MWIAIKPNNYMKMKIKYDTYNQLIMSEKYTSST